MKKATKLTAVALAATLSLSLAACGSSASTGTASTSASADGVVYLIAEIRRNVPVLRYANLQFVVRDAGNARWTKSRRTARSTSAFSLTRTRSATSTKTASIRAMTSTLPTVWPRIWASR